MRRPSFAGVAVCALLLLVTGEATLVQGQSLQIPSISTAYMWDGDNALIPHISPSYRTGRAVSVPITEYRTSLPRRRDGTSYNGSYMVSEQGICSVEGVTESDANVSQAYHCFASGQDSLPPLLLDGDESGGRWSTSEDVANYYIFPATAAEEPFVTFTVPGNWCISTLNLTFYKDALHSISPPSNVTLRSSNISAYRVQMDHEFTQSSHILPDNRTVLSYELARDVCDVYLKIELSGCREQACTHYYLSEVNAVHRSSDSPNGEPGMHRLSVHLCHANHPRLDNSV